MKKKDETLLNRFDIFKIRNRNRKNELSKELYKSEKEHSQLNTQIELDKIGFESDKIDALNQFASKKVTNAKMNAKLAKLDRAIEFQNTLNQNDLVEIKNTKKRAKKFKRGSLITGIVSAITTCIGIGVTASGVWLFQCVAIIVACVYVNREINTLVSFKDRFFNGTRFDKLLLAGKSLIICSYTSYSIATNFSFWKNYFNGIGLVMFSVIFDLLSLMFAFENNKYENLEYSESYLEKINSVFDEVETPVIEDQSNNDLKKKKWA